MELDTWVLWGVGPLLSKVEQVQYAVYSLRYIPHLSTRVCTPMLAPQQGEFIKYQRQNIPEIKELSRTMIKT